MGRSYLVKLAISLPLLVVLTLMDEITALQSLPLLLIALGLALLASEPLRLRLASKGRVGIAMLPFMAAALVLMLVYCWKRDLSQAILLLITVGVVFDILLVALAAIGEVTKRGAKGMAEFFGLVAVGMVLGGIVSLLLVLFQGAGGVSLAGPR
jgi:hypothetical protein